MLELSQIGFAVNTKPLEDAATKLAALGTAATKLAVDLKKLDKASADAAINQNKVNLAAEKTATQAAKTAEVLERTETKKLKAIEKTNKATEAAQVAQVGLVDSMERKRDLISEGWTRGESSILKTAEALGIAGDEYKRLQSLLKDIGGLVSSPFDSSLGSLRSIQKEFDGLVLRSKLVAQGIELNSTQLKQFARIAAEASVAVKKMGMDPTEGAGLEMYNKLLTESQDAYLKVAVANKTMLDGEKLLAKQHRDTASAKNFLIKEDERMVSVMEQLNTGTNRSVSISEKAAIATANYARALKTAGVAGDEAKNKLAKYSAAQQLASQKEEQRAAANLARALQPQATDVVVSLWSGQNPLTVMLQQGGQVVDLFKLSGVEANKLGQTMKTAFAGMLPSIMAVGGAVGGLLVDGVVAAGSAFTGLFTKMTLVQKASEMTKRALASMGDDGFSAIGKLNKIMKGFNIAIGLAAAASVIALISVAVAFKQVTEAQDKLTRATISSGAYLGITTKEAYALSTSLGAVGATTVDAIKVMTKLTEGGVITADAFKMVTSAALELENVGGRSAEKTVEMFNKLGEKPVEALSEYAIKSGLVNQAEIERINTLVKAGEEINATTEATKILSKAVEAEASIIYANLSPISRLWIDIKNGTSDAWGAVQEFAGSDTLVKPLATIMQTVAVIATEVWFAVKGIAESLGGLGAIVGAVMTDIKNLDSNFSASKSVIEGINEADKAREKSYNNAIDRIMQEGEYSKEALEQKAKGTANLAKANSDAEKNRLAHEEAMKPWKEYEKKHLDDTLTRQQFINRAIEDANKKKIQGTVLDKKSLDFITTQAGRQWDDGNKKKKAKSDPATKELENYIKKTEERIKDLGIQASGITNDITASGKALMDIMDDKLWLSLTQEQRVQWGLMLRKSEEQEILNKKVTAEKKILEDIAKIRDDNTRFIQNETQESQKLNDGFQLRLDLIGKTAEEQKKIQDAYNQATKLSALDSKFADQRLKIEQKFRELRDKPNADLMQIEADRMTEQERLEKQFQASRITLSKEASVITAEDFYNEMKKISTPIADALSEALLKGGEGAFDDMWKSLQNEFINKPFKIRLEGIVDQVTSLLSGSDKFNTSSLFSNGSKMSGTDKVGGVMSYVDALSNFKDGSFGKSIGQGIGTFFGGSFGGQIGKMLGGVVDKWFSKEYVASTGDSARVYDANGNVTSAQKMSGVFTNNASADSVVDALQKQYSDTAKALGIGTIATQFSYGGNNSDGGKFALGGGAGTVSTYQGETKSTPEALQLASARAVFAALQGSALPKYLAGIFDGMTAGSMTSAEIDAAIKGAEVFKALNETLTQMPFAGLSDLSYKAMSNLIEFAGGLDSLQNSLGGFYQNFYSDQEKIANSTKYLTSQFSSLGIVMPAVNEDMRTWYRTEVERALALDQSIPANAKLTAGLLAMQGAVSDLAPVAEEVAVSLEKQIEWQRKLDVLTGKTTQRELEKADALADADETTRKIILDYYAYEDAQIAAAAATELAKKALEALQTETQKAMTDMVTLWGDLTGAMNEINKPAATLVEQWRANSAELQTLTQGLAEALGELPEDSALDKLKNVLSALASATGGIADLNNQIFELKVGQGGANAVGLLQDKERSLYAEMQTSNDPGAVAAKLASTTISRIKLQAEIADKYKNDGFKAQEESLINIAKLEKENREKQIDALQKQISAAETLVDVVGGLKNYIAELKFGDLSALNPTDQLSTARSLFESTLAGARGGDAKAMQNLQGYSSSYLQEAQGYYGGATSEYASIFQSVTGLLDEFSTTPITDIELLTSQLEKLQLIADSSTALQTVTTDTSALQITSLTEIRDALSEREQQLQKQADDAKVVAQAQIDALKEIVTGQEAQIKQHAAEYEVLNTKLTDIGKSLESIDATNKQVAAST